MPDVVPDDPVEPLMVGAVEGLVEKAVGVTVGEQR